MDDLVTRLHDAKPPHHRKCLQAADEIERLRAELARVRALGDAMAGALACVLDDSHSCESEGYARDTARTALAAWNEGAWRNAARTGGASPGLFPNPTPLRGRSA